MDSKMNRISTYWQDSLNFLLGGILFLSPWLFGFAADNPAAWNAHIVGAIIAVMALAALYAFQPWEEWVSGVLGAWVAVAPWVLGFSALATAMLTHVIIGVAVLVLAIWAATTHGSGHQVAG